MFNLNDIFTYNERSPMLFTKMAFWIFFAIVLIVYSFIYKKNNLRTAWLFPGKLVFLLQKQRFFLYSSYIQYSLRFFPCTAHS